MAGGQPALTFFRKALQSFISSQSSLRILRTLPSMRDKPNLQPSQLFVLDSSFNPPTRAHLDIVSSAVLNAHSAELPKRLVLLLATRNADKPAKPASFEHRLCMMASFAEDLQQHLRANGHSGELAVDVGVTKLPYFVGKAGALSSPDQYSFGTFDGHAVEQVHLIGYDTLIRILDPKYYPPDHKLTSLATLFQHHRLRVTERVDASWGSEADQDGYLRVLRSGERESDGADPAWADRIDLVRSANQEVNTVSSTRAREAAAAGNQDEIKSLCPTNVANYVLDEHLYTEVTDD